MQHQLLFKLLKVLCLGTAIHGLGWLAIEPIVAQTTAPTSTPPVAPVIAPTVPVPATPPAPIEPPSLPVVNRTAPAVQIVSPTPSSVLDVPATAIVVQYRVGTKGLPKNR